MFTAAAPDGVGAAARRREEATGGALGDECNTDGWPRLATRRAGVNGSSRRLEERYIRDLADASGFRIDDIVRAPIRYDQTQPVEGMYVYLS